jgi:hypothetical protein
MHTIDGGGVYDINDLFVLVQAISLFAHQKKNQSKPSMLLENVQNNFVESSCGNLICCKPMSFLKMGWWNAHTPKYF